MEETSSIADSAGSSCLAASTEDIFHDHKSSFNELMNESVSCSPLQNLASPSAADEEAKVKRSNSGFTRSPYRGGTQTGLTSPEPIARMFIIVTLIFLSVVLVLLNTISHREDNLSMPNV